MRKTIPTAEERLNELTKEDARQHRVFNAYWKQQPKSLHLLELGILAVPIAAVLFYVIERWP